MRAIFIIIFAQIIFLISIVESTRNIFFEDNEVTNQSSHFITMKFPVMDEILLKHKKMPRKSPLSSTMVVPVQENCRTASFQAEVKLLRKKVRCKPRDTIVDLRSSTGGIMTPNAVIVKRCSGGSCTKPKACTALERKNTTFFVKSVENKKLVCNSIVVSEDVKCGCACEPNLKKCKPNQVYNHKACGCVCDNIEDFVNCMQSVNYNMQWDEKNCSCVCQQSNRSCTTGTFWVSSECRCVKK